MPFLTVNLFSTTPGGAWASSTPGTTGVALGLATGAGANLPVVASPDTLRLKVSEGGNVEHMDVTTHTGTSDSITVTRGVEGVGRAAAACFSFTVAAVVECVLTDAQIQRLSQRDRANVLTPPAAAVATPAADTLADYVQKTGGRMFPYWQGPSGVPYAVQPALFGNQFVKWRPATGTTAGTSIGALVAAGGLVSGGTVSHPVIVTTAPKAYNVLRRTRWANVVTTTNQALGLASAVAHVWRGDAAGLGGFYFYARVAFPLFPAGTRVFVGLSSVLTAGMVTADVTGATGSYIGLGMIAGDTNLTVMHSDGTTLTKDAIGAGEARTANTWYDVILFSAPNGANIWVTVIRYSNTTGVGTTIFNQAVSTTIPLATAMLAPHLLMSNGTANTVVTTVAIEGSLLYLESDS